MNSDSKWQNVLRVVWMSGGLVAINKAGPKVQISAGLNGPNVCTFGIDEYAALFHILRVRGFLIVGTTFVLDAGELQGFARPDFRVMSQSEGWLIWDEIQKWRQIAFAAGKSAQMSLMDIASRIACGLRYSQMRVADLAAAYSAQLRAYLHAHRADEYVAFKDTYSFDVYKSIHALFWEMAVLRDTLAEFAAAFCFSQSSLRTMRGLRKWLQANHRDDSLAPEILRITDSSRNGWLATFSNYRNCFTHSAPLEQVAGIAFAVQDMKTLSDGSRVPQIYYALPQDVEAVERNRLRGIFPASIDELTAASSRRHERVSEPDALEYLHTCINNFAHLSLTVVCCSSIAPAPIRLGPEDIIAGIKVSGG